MGHPPFRAISFPLLLILTAGCSYLPLAGTARPVGVEIRESRDAIRMTPASGSPDGLGLIFWPGGLVDPHGYCGSLAPLVRRGHPVVIVKVPANLAVLSIEKGLDTARELGGTWAAGGHSLGGAMAAWTVRDNPHAFEALILMAAYPAEDKSLAGWDRPVLSLYGEKDGLAPPAEIESKKPLLPAEPAPTLYQIEGGNHAQFGSYGAQNGDNPASITPETQHTLMADQMEDFLAAVEEGTYAAP